MIYKSLEHFEDTFPFLYSGKPEGIKVFILAEEETDRLRGCNSIKKVLEGILGESKTDGHIKGYEVEIRNVAHTDPTKDVRWMTFWDEVGENDGKVYVPIFHNADKCSGLPQKAFDDYKPGIFSMNHKEYDSVINYSKRGCFDVLDLDRK